MRAGLRASRWQRGPLTIRVPGAYGGSVVVRFSFDGISGDAGMSNRFVNAVFGETRQERKRRVLFAMCLSIVIGGGFWWYGRIAERQVYLASQRTGRGLVDQVILSDHWQKLEVNPPARDLSRWLSKDLNNQEFSWSLVQPQPEGDKSHDQFEWQILKEFQSQPRREADEAAGPEFRDRRLVHRAEYQYYQPVRAKPGACIECHNVLRGAAGLPEWKVGDLMAVVKVVLPDKENIDDLARNRAMLLTTASITVVLAMAGYTLIHGRMKSDG